MRGGFLLNAGRPDDNFARLRQHPVTYDRLGKRRAKCLRASGLELHQTELSDVVLRLLKGAVALESHCGTRIEDVLR